MKMKNPVNAIASAACFFAAPAWLCMANPPIWITALAVIWAGCIGLWLLCVVLYVIAPKGVKAGMEDYLVKRLKKELGD